MHCYFADDPYKTSLPCNTPLPICYVGSVFHGLSFLNKSTCANSNVLHLHIAFQIWINHNIIHKLPSPVPQIQVLKWNCAIKWYIYIYIYPNILFCTIFLKTMHSWSKCHTSLQSSVVFTDPGNMQAVTLHQRSQGKYCYPSTAHPGRACTAQKSLNFFPLRDSPPDPPIRRSPPPPPKKKKTHHVHLMGTPKPGGRGGASRGGAGG